MEYKRKYSKSAMSNPEVDKIEDALQKLEKELGIEIYAKHETCEICIKSVIHFNKK